MKTPAHKLRKRIFTLLIGLLSLCAVALPSSQAAPRHNHPPTGIVSIDLAPNAKPLGMTMNIGIQVKNIYDMNLADQSFLAEGWYWLNWGDDIQATLERLKIEPSQIVEFANEIEPGQYSVIEPLPESIATTSSKKYSFYAKFSGKFYINEVHQRFAPFDNQAAEIALEIKPSALTQSPDRVTLIPLPIKQAPIAGEFTEVNGYLLTDTTWQRHEVRYYEPLADQQGQSKSFSDYSRATAVFTYSPNPIAVVLKWLLPIMVVMGIVVAAPSIDGVLGDVRLAIPSAALLTLVVLQDAYKANFPPAPYLTYLDEIYAYSYLACFSIFLLFLFGTNAHSRALEEDRQAVTKKVDRIDLIVQVSTVAGFLLVAIIGWYT